MNFELLKECITLLEKSNFCEKHKKDFTTPKKVKKSDFQTTFLEVEDDKFTQFCFERLHALYLELETQLYKNE